MGRPGRPFLEIMTFDIEERPVRPRRILIAEDVDINREILSSVLADDGHELVFAQDGAEALALVQGGAFDLILMDVQMPVMDGVEATVRIRALQGPEHTIPIFALSANLTEPERQRYLTAGMNDCLVKPYDWEQLAAAIDQAGADNRDPSASRADRTAGRPEARLVTPEVLARLQRATGPNQLRMMVQMGIEAYGCYCDVMLDPTSGPVDVGREAHKLRGSAGTFGFERISVIAAQIEDAIDGGTDASSMLHELKAAIIDTRAELMRLGALTNE